MATGVRNSSHVGLYGLNFIKENVKRMWLLKTLPGTFALTTVTSSSLELAYHALTSANFAFSTDTTVAILTVTSATNWTRDSTGAANYIALGSSATEGGSSFTGLFYVAPLASSQTINSTANLINLSTWRITISDGDTA